MLRHVFQIRLVGEEAGDKENVAVSRKSLHAYRDDGLLSGVRHDRQAHDASFDVHDARGRIALGKDRRRGRMHDAVGAVQPAGAWPGGSEDPPFRIDNV